MSSSLGPIRCDCDAPPYPVVEACETLGFQSPLDVRWVRMSRFLMTPREVGDGRDLNPWAWLLTSGRPPRTACSCGQSLPAMQCCVFRFASGREVNYFLGQCPRCRAMFWDEPDFHSHLDPGEGGG